MIHLHPEPPAHNEGDEARGEKRKTKNGQETAHKRRDQD